MNYLQECRGSERAGMMAGGAAAVLDRRAGRGGNIGAASCAKEGRTQGVAGLT